MPSEKQKNARFASLLKIRFRKARTAYSAFTFHFASNIRNISKALSVTTGICSFICIGVLIVMVGFDHHPSALHTIAVTLRVIQSIFLFAILFNLIFNLRYTISSTRTLKWIVDIAMLTTLLPLIYPHPENPWIRWLEQLLYSHRYIYIVMGAYSLVDGCYGLMRLMSRRTNPSLLLGTTFLFFIIAGSLVLMMPRCRLVPISYTDAFFVSTSAVSITGLTTLDLTTTFTPMGQIVICLLLQVGGIGIITFTSFFAIFYSGNQSIYSQLLIKDIVYTKSMSDLVPTLLTILFFTLSIELVGAVAVYFTIPDSLGLGQHEKIWAAVFHSTSSFCNAGFSVFPDGMANPALMGSGQGIYLVTSFIVLAGGIGFPILVNFREMTVAHLRRFFTRVLTGKHCPRRSHIIDLNTKLVLISTLSILAISTLLFFIIESGNSMRGMSLYERISQSIFNSLTPRSAGFVSIGVQSFMPLTLMLVMAQMWIGGASQSMAGGIKVNTLAVLLLNLRSIIRGSKGVSAFDRNIAIPSVRRSNAVITLSLIFTFTVCCTLIALEPAISTKALIFESISAVFTVGSSFGITPGLCVASKYILCVAMFVGRVGLISLLTGMFSHGPDRTQHYPSENIVIS